MEPSRVKTKYRITPVIILTRAVNGYKGYPCNLSFFVYKDCTWDYNIDGLLTCSLTELQNGWGPVKRVQSKWQTIVSTR